MENMTAKQIKTLVAEWLDEAMESDERRLAATGRIFRFKDEYGNEATVEEHAESCSPLANDRAEQLVNCGCDSLYFVSHAMLSKEKDALPSLLFR